MSKNADVIREGLTIGQLLAYEHEQPWPGNVFAALDALIAERDETRKDKLALALMVEAAEADRDSLLDALRQIASCESHHDEDVVSVARAALAAMSPAYIVKAAGLCHPTKPNYPGEE